MDDNQLANDTSKVDYLNSPEAGTGMGSVESHTPIRVERPAGPSERPAAPVMRENTGPQIASLRGELGKMSGDIHPEATAHLMEDNKKVEEKVVVVERPVNDQERMWNTAFDVVGKIGTGIKMAVKAVGAAVGALMGGKG